MLTIQTLKKIMAVYASVLILIACGSKEDPFAEETSSAEENISIEEAFKILAEENDKTRTLYTKKIVGLGKKAGLNFHEDWQKKSVEAGPLPALFLRGTSDEIQKTGVPLGLYLGSDFPIVKANKFLGVQAEKFAKIRETSEPEFFYDADNELYTAMFPDFAAAAPCVSCHNGHDNTTKTDWELGDIMGATTWTYPKENISTSELLTLIKTYRKGVEKTYVTFLDEVKGFSTNNVPDIGTKWSDEGYSIPDLKTFIKAVNMESAPTTLNEILKNT